MMEKMDEVILGENKSLDRVEKDLNLLTEWKDYPVQIQWELDHYEVMNVQGEIQTEKTKAEGTLVELTGKLTYGGEEALYVTNAMVYPESKSKEENYCRMFCNWWKKKKKQQRLKKYFRFRKNKRTTNSLEKESGSKRLLCTCTWRGECCAYGLH